MLVGSTLQVVHESLSQAVEQTDWQQFARCDSVGWEILAAFGECVSEALGVAVWLSQVAHESHNMHVLECITKAP